MAPKLVFIPCDCRIVKGNDDYGPCDGMHVRQPASERPFLTGEDFTTDEIVRRILATPQWRGAQTSHVRARLRVKGSLFSPPREKDYAEVVCVKIEHPEGAIAFIPLRAKKGGKKP